MIEPPKHVLIVDDHHGVATALCVALRADGRMAPLDPSGTVADAVTKAPGADAIVLDLNLMDSEGLATLKTVRASAPSVPIVVYSADEEQARLAGPSADACIPKGELGTLLDTLAHLVGLPARIPE